MKPFARFFTAFAIVALAACSAPSFGGGSLLPQSGERLSIGNLSVEGLAVLASPRVRACEPAPPGYATCYAIVGTYPLVPDGVGQCKHEPGCYLASDLQAAYGLTEASKRGGAGVTVAVVDAYGYPDARRDLAVYRSYNHMRPCGAGCLRIVNQTGGSSLPPPASTDAWRWQSEIALDLDMVSAICPRCNILLVEVNNNYVSSLTQGVVTALQRAKIVSNSWGGGETASSSSIFDNHPGKIVTASAGDDGAGAPPAYGRAPETQPCGFRGVVCVGGTSLQLSGGSRLSEVVWQDFHVAISGKFINLGATGSGCSARVPKPSWQHDKGCRGRSASDVSADADPLTGVVTACTPCAQKYGYNTPLLSGWGGTSASSPMIAAMYALAGNFAKLSSAPETIWQHGGSTDFNPVTRGYNDKAGYSGLICGAAIAYICKAGVRPNRPYSGPAGWGTPNGLGAF